MPPCWRQRGSIINYELFPKSYFCDLNTIQSIMKDKGLLCIVLMIILSFYGLMLNAQIISQFSWDSNPVTAADVGPDAISVSSSATSSAGGAGGTNGLNAALPKLDIDLVIADSSIFDVDGIEISFDYQRDESAGNFFQRGNSLSIDGTNQLSVTYRVEDGLGGFTTVRSGNAYNIPNDDTFRNYRFYYVPVTGVGALVVDGVTVWSNDGPDNRNMYWTGAGDLEIGVMLDGSGSNKAFLDNFILAEISNAPLPIELAYFRAEPAKANTVNLYWQTSSEINNDYFTIEKSKDAENWIELLRIDGAGNSTRALNYSATDDDPYLGISYYRLKQTDYNGEYSHSEIRPVEILSNLDLGNLLVFPNPFSDHFRIEQSIPKDARISIYDSKAGQIQPSIILRDNNIEIHFNGKPGIYLMRISYKAEEYSYRLVKMAR